MFKLNRFNKFAAGIALLSVVAFASAAYANHSWGDYHWARSANPLILKAGDNVSSVWDDYLNEAIGDWSLSSVLDLEKVDGGTNNSKGKYTPKNCVPTTGRLEVCNAKYGGTGWLGVARIWVSGGHIVQGTAKMNDSYFNTAKYNTTAWRRLVMCQEVAHDFGLDHQDEIFNNANLGSCMDYTNNPGTNQHPNQHDYDELELIYAHLDSTTTLSQTLLNPGQGNFDNPTEWGRLVKKQGRVAVFERDFGLGNKLFTFVIYAD